MKADIHPEYNQVVFQDLSSDFKILTRSTMSSKEILDTYKDTQLNDLLQPCLDLYPKLKDSQKDGWFFSGSGSTFFKVNHG
jgi:4-diphosphocytidyl-2C-methyl-D-erythritol kinase